MAYGRVNILGQGGIESIKTIDYGEKKDHIFLIDFKRKRKIFKSYNKQIIYDFNDNIVGKIDDDGFRLPHVGFVGTSYGKLYNLTTGNETTLPEEMHITDDFILNEDKDYYSHFYKEIRDKYGNVLYEGITMRGSSNIFYIQNDVIYFLSGSRIYRYKDRKLSFIAGVSLRGQEDLEHVNFL